jgi:hypothetical protein
MKKQIFAVTFLMFAGHAAFANKVVQCEETTSNNSGSREKFEFEINEKNQLVTVKSINWSDKTNSQAGDGGLGYHEKSLNSKTKHGAYVFTYKFQDEGDGDYKGPVTDVTVTLSPDFSHASVNASYDDGASGSDTFDLVCK